MPETPFEVEDLGRMSYAEAYKVQCARQQRVIDARSPEENGASIFFAREHVGVVLLVEHDPVITISRRASATKNLLASPRQLAQAGVQVAETDRGGDITYHGPGQLVIYPILDLSAMNVGLHEYMRMLEGAVIATCAKFGVEAAREQGATGVWVPSVRETSPAKIAAMGVRVKKWVSMHGLALNVTTDLRHFDLIVPCGLAGRRVTSLQRELEEACPSAPEVKTELVGAIARECRSAIEEAIRKRGAARS